MAATFSLERVRHHIVPAIAGLVGLGVAVGIATVPSDVLNAAVDRGGFSGILPAAASPIGATGRTLLALLVGGLIAALGFVPQLKAMLVERVDAFARRPRGTDEENAPVVRRADAHPDAPPRRPIRAASDLGDPLPIFGEEDRRSAPLPPPLERSLPDDLDRPLADFDPAAVPLRPMAPPEPVAPLARIAEPPQPEIAPITTVSEPSIAPPPRFAWLAPDEADDAPAASMPIEPQPLAKQAAPRPIVVPAPRVEAAPTVYPSSPFDHAPRPGAMMPPSIDAAEPEVPPASVMPTRVDTAATPELRPSRRNDEPLSGNTMPSPVIDTGPEIAPAPAVPSPVTAAAPEPAADDSIAGLLARLERGAAQRRIVATPIVSPPATPAPPAEPVAAAPAPDAAPVSLDETLQRLRRLAAG